MATATPFKNDSANDALQARDIQQNIEKIRTDIAALSGSLEDLGEQKTHEYSSKVAKTTQEVRAKTKAALKDLKAELSKYENQLEDHVREHPLRSIGIAAGVSAGIGFLAASLLRR